MPAPTHLCSLCRQPLPARDQLILDLVQTAASYEEIAAQVTKQFGGTCSTKTVQRVAARYSLARQPGRPWPRRIE